MKTYLYVITRLITCAWRQHTCGAQTQCHIYRYRVFYWPLSVESACSRCLANRRRTGSRWRSCTARWRSAPVSSRSYSPAVAESRRRRRLGMFDPAAAASAAAATERRGWRVVTRRPGRPCRPSWSRRPSVRCRGCRSCTSATSARSCARRCRTCAGRRPS